MSKDKDTPPYKKGRGKKYVGFKTSAGRNDGVVPGDVVGTFGIAGRVEAVREGILGSDEIIDKLDRTNKSLYELSGVTKEIYEAVIASESKIMEEQKKGIEFFKEAVNRLSDEQVSFKKEVRKDIDQVRTDMNSNYRALDEKLDSIYQSLTNQIALSLNK